MRSIACFGLAVVVCLGIAPPVRADIMVPGQRSIVHTFEVTGLERVPPGTILVVAPLHLGMGSAVLEPGVSFSYRRKYARPILYAVTGADAKGPIDPKKLEGSDAPRAVDPFPVTNSVRSVSPVERMHSVYEFQGIRDGRIELRHVTTARYDGAGSEVTGSGWSWPPVALSGAALAGLVFMAIRWRRRAAPSIEE